MKKIVILGSTGSVGTSALDIISRHRDLFTVVGLSAQKNVGLLAKQIKRFKPRFAAIGDESKYNELKKLLKTPKKILLGPGGIEELASMKEADIVVVAISGISAALPILSAIKAGKQIALSNKEAIVSAGPIIKSMAKTHGVKIIPVDSEHNSIFRCLEGRKKECVAKLYLMGTGGPLRKVSKSMFGKFSQARILAHPVWKMGKKISVDSATMMNKGLELIEAHYLFGTEIKKIEILFHPEAIIHGMVEMKDGSVFAHMFIPDMRFPIMHALCYPDVIQSRLPRIDFPDLGNFSFEKPNMKKFPALRLSYDAVKKGGTYPAALNSANEEAVRLYLGGRIKFMKIIDIIEKVVTRHKTIKNPSIDQILHVAGWAKNETRRLC
ncbi:MAG: 1-deoxy-D-xylulose-5-phosphate reductoisomerase [Candidatus Omnitrophica bacterium]|nr:1-deoxy-D-xylulose-5-phosphate reductoisomerase [Candidatus Omnitrophota bacterium]